jgi:hypothetical protein
MPTTIGTVTGTSPGQWSALFKVNNIAYYFSATMVQAVNFSSTAATLTYNKESDLTGNHAYSGVIGATDFTIKFLDNGNTITGSLTTPLDKSYNVNGAGIWAIGYKGKS